MILIASFIVSICIHFFRILQKVIPKSIVLLRHNITYELSKAMSQSLHHQNFQHPNSAIFCIKTDVKNLQEFKFSSLQIKRSVKLCKINFFINIFHLIISFDSKMRKNTPAGKAKTSTFKAQDYQRPGVSNDQISQLKQAFDLFDVNGTGVVNAKELKAAFSAQGYEQTSPTLFHIISDLSNSAVSTLDFSSFVDIMTASAGVKVTKKTVKKVFSLFDDERAGFVSTKNIKRLAKELNIEISEHELQAMIEKADLDRDGLVSEEEFYHIMSR